MESHEQVEVRLAESEIAGWRSLAREFELAAGVSQARVVLRDPRAGTMGATSHRFEVPSTEGLRLTTPILTDRVERGKGADDNPRAAHRHRSRLPLRAGPFTASSRCWALRRIPGSAPLASARASRCAPPTAAIVRKGEPTPIATDPRGRLVRLIGIGMDGLARRRISAACWTCATTSPESTSSGRSPSRCGQGQTDGGEQEMMAE